MNLDDVKDQIKEGLTTLWGQIQENSTFNTLRERYQTLSTGGQKGIQAGVIIFALLILIYIPYSYFSSSATFVEDFENNRQMIRSLLKASRNAKLPPPLPPEQTAPALEGRVRRVLEGARLLPEQIGGVNPLSDAPAASLVPPVIKQNGVGVEVKTLNLAQIIDIGDKLQRLDPGTKMIGLEMKAATKAGYFDVLYKLVNFSLEIVTEPTEPAAPGRPKGRR